MIDRLQSVCERSYLWLSFGAAPLCVRLLLRVIFIPLELKKDKTMVRHIEDGIKADHLAVLRD